MVRQADCGVLVDKVMRDSDDRSNRGTFRAQRQMTIHETQYAVVSEKERCTDRHRGHHIAKDPDPHEVVLHNRQYRQLFRDSVGIWV